MALSHDMAGIELVPEGRLRVHVGDTFSRLVVIGHPFYLHGQRTRQMAVCQCECGTILCVACDSLVYGNGKSCGCYKSERASQLKTKHGLSGDRIYSIWKGMRDRCENPRSPAYEEYGALGIIICEEWRSSVRSFFSWAISSGYSDGLEIDRIDPFGDYCSSNCRWVTESQQMMNRRKDRQYAGKPTSSSYKGVRMLHGKWEARICASGQRITIGHFSSEIEAAKAYDSHAVSIFGEFARLNFPETAS